MQPPPFKKKKKKGWRVSIAKMSVAVSINVVSTVQRQLSIIQKFQTVCTELKPSKLLSPPPHHHLISPKSTSAQTGILHGSNWRLPRNNSIPSTVLLFVCEREQAKTTAKMQLFPPTSLKISNQKLLGKRLAHSQSPEWSIGRSRELWPPR